MQQADILLQRPAQLLLQARQGALVGFCIVPRAVAARGTQADWRAVPLVESYQNDVDLGPFLGQAAGVT